MKRSLTCTFVLSTLLVASSARAQAAAPAPAPATAPAPAPAPAQASASVSLGASTNADTTSAPAAKDRGAFVVAGKVGGLVAFSGLSPNVRGALELGYVFPFLKRSFAAVLDVGYAAPQTDGTNPSDPRVAGGTYNWHLTEQELTVMPTLVYRFTALGKIVPYVGIGPRVYMLRSNVRGDVGGKPISETTEQSMKFGAGVPIGAQYELGPGGLTAEVLLEYGPLDHTATGDSNTGAASLLLGYRFLL